MLEFHIRSGTYWKDKRLSAYENYAQVKCSELLGVICISVVKKKFRLAFIVKRADMWIALRMQC